jgi:N-acetylated-alpha-linked acidic dipeptidase
MLAKTVGRIVMRVADSDLPVQNASDFANAVSNYLDQIKKLADDERDEAEAQAKLLHDRAFQLAADPTKPGGLPTPLDRVPQFDFAPLKNAVDRLKRAAKSYDDALAKNGAHLSAIQVARLQALMVTIDQTLAPENVGLPGRSWYKNLVYAPGRYTGYESKTLPGVREAIEDRRWPDVNRYIPLTAQALNAYSDRLDAATAVLNGS